MWWCRSRLYFLSIDGLMKASTVYISLLKMYYIFQTQCLRYDTSMQKLSKIVGNEIIFYWWLTHACMSTISGTYQKEYSTMCDIKTLPHYPCTKGKRQRFDVKHSWIFCLIIMRMAKCQHHNFDGVFCYKSSSMLIHPYTGLALVYGWMTRLILLHTGNLGILCKKSLKKHDFCDFLLESSFLVIETQTLLQMCSRGCFWS